MATILVRNILRRDARTMLMRVARCGLTFLTIQAPGITKSCGICNSDFLLFSYLMKRESEMDDYANEKANEVFEASERGSLSFLQALVEACDKCLYCGGTFVKENLG
jgi:hypothetical protein